MPLQGPSSSFPQLHGMPEPVAPRIISKIKLPTGKRSGASDSQGGGEATKSTSSEPSSRAKRARQQSKASLDGDYEYGAEGEEAAFGAEADPDDPDMLEDYEEDYDVLGKPRRAKGTKQRGGAGGQV